MKNNTDDNDSNFKMANASDLIDLKKLLGTTKEGVTNQTTIDLPEIKEIGMGKIPAIDSTDAINNKLTDSLISENDNDSLGDFTLDDETSNLDNISEETVLLDTFTDQSDKVELFQVEYNEDMKNGKSDTILFNSLLVYYHSSLLYFIFKWGSLWNNSNSVTA